MKEPSVNLAMLDLITILTNHGFEIEHDSPQSCAYSYYLPSGRFILVSNASGGWIPTTEELGVYACLYDSEAVPLGNSVGISETVISVLSWLHTTAT